MLQWVQAMHDGITFHETGWSKAFYDWQTVVVGTVAVLAAGRAVQAANRQARAAERQLQYMHLEAKRSLARQGISAIRLVDGVLVRLKSDMIRLQEKFDEFARNNRSMLQTSIMNDDDKMILVKPSLSVVWSSIGILNPDTITSYIDLDAVIDQFRTSKIIGMEWYRDQLKILIARTSLIQDMLVQQGKSAHNVILETDFHI